MKVTMVACTMFYPNTAAQHSGYITQWDYMKSTFERTDDGRWPSSADELAEFAGRNCYQAWHRPNPHTASNRGYLNNILIQGHESVLEHASATFHISGVSTALLGQLTRHRHLSFSVLSKRYVDESSAKYVIHPMLAEFLGERLYNLPQEDELHFLDPTVEELLHQWQKDAQALYTEMVAFLESRGKTRKEAREIARGVLPQGTETSIVVTGNMRAWRDALRKRNHPAADAEIRALAVELLKQLKKVAPNSFQDMEAWNAENTSS